MEKDPRGHTKRQVFLIDPPHDVGKINWDIRKQVEPRTTQTMEMPAELGSAIGSGSSPQKGVSQHSCRRSATTSPGEAGRQKPVAMDAIPEQLLGACREESLSRTP